MIGVVGVYLGEVSLSKVVWQIHLHALVVALGQYIIVYRVVLGVHKFRPVNFAEDSPRVELGIYVDGFEAGRLLDWREEPIACCDHCVLVDGRLVRR